MAGWLLPATDPRGTVRYIGISVPIVQVPYRHRTGTLILQCTSPIDSKNSHKSGQSFKAKLVFYELINS